MESSKSASTFLFTHLLLFAMFAGPASSDQAYGQDALGNYQFVHEVPPRNPGLFGFPYPPPPPGEPGVTFRRRYMLDGAQELMFQPRINDQIWLVSTRHLNQFGDGTVKCFRVTGDRVWRPDRIERLLADHVADTSRQTFVFVHGNRTDPFWGQRRGKQAYQAIFGNHPDVPPVRFVIWSWPSDSIPHPAKDIRKKMDRAVLDGRMLARFVDELGDHRRIALMGYSLGTQILLTACTELAECRQDHSAGEGFRTTVVAPVTHCDWPETPEQGTAVAQMIRTMSAFRNPTDTAICAFKLYCRTHSTNRCSTKTYGIDRIPFATGQLQQFDVSAAVGKEHNMVQYMLPPIVQIEAAKMISNDLASAKPNRRN